LNLPPSKLTIEQLDVTLIVDFLNHLENKRGNSARTRNARSAAIKAFFRFLEYRVASCLDQSRRIQAIPIKKADDRLISHLTPQEIQTLVDTPDPHTILGIRDRAMLHLCFSAGLRVSELINLQCDQLEWHSQPAIHVIGKGRRERILPLWKETAMVLKAWMAVRPKKDIVPELFLNAQGRAMTRSGFEYILSKHVKTAIPKQPSLAKKCISPHVLRHSCAMCTLKATHDIRKVALWLGHADLRSTAIYLRADPSEKLEMLMEVAPPTIRQGKFNAPDKLLAMLKEKI
jgi:site-specific recombinase XerD